MGRYMAAVFSDLEQHSEVWNRTPRQVVVATIAEYRYLAETIASQFGSTHRNFTGDGHLFLFDDADAAVQFSLKLIEAWKNRGGSLTGTKGGDHLPMRIGCHFGECAQLEGEDAWVGRAINLAKRVEGEARPDTVYVTENVLELVDLPLYRFEEVGTHALKGDHLPDRRLYRLSFFEQSDLDAKPEHELTANRWFLRAAALIGTPEENGETEAAYYREALRLRPNYAEAHNNLAILLRAAGDLSSAAEHYQEALRLRPGYPEALYNYAILLESRGSTEGAAEHYAEALRVRPDYVDAHHGYANLLKGGGRLSEAEEHYRAAIGLRPEYAEVHNNYAIVLEDKGDVEGAAGHYEEALRIRPDYPEANYNYALLLENRGYPKEADEHYREALRLRPDYAEAHNNLAILLQSQGKLVEAERHYRETLRMRPDDPEAHYNYALLLRTKGDPGAEEHFKTAYGLAPDVPAFKSAIEPPA